MSLSLLELEQGWFSHPLGRKRALGGRQALMGFSYQLSLSLERFFDQVLAGQSDAQMAFEGLADLSMVRGDLVYLTQVKSALTAAKAKDAIKEALAVDQYLEEQHPELRSGVRYQICCRRFRTDVDPRQLSADAIGLDASLITRWNDVGPRVLPVVVRGNPFLELAIKLFSKVPNTFDFLDALVGELVRLLGENQPSERICEALLERWDASRCSEQLPGVLLKPSYFLDESEGADYVSVGERPRLEHLAKGCFMDRPALVHRVLESVRMALEGETEGMPERTIPVVWTSGASGAGKSVLLLQTLQALVTEGDSVVHFLDHFPESLPEALDYWSRQSERAVSAVDDLFAPENRSLEVWHEVHRLAYQASWTVYPVILTSGPDDYREAFDEEVRRGGGLRVTTVEIPNLDDEEQQRYHDWYCRRTKEQVPRIREPIFVVAAFTLELSRGGSNDIGEFAQRLADRLQHLDLAQEALSALAFNLLGLSAPMTLFLGKEDQLRRLIEEEIFRIPQTAPQDESVQMFHPQIAKALYDILVPPRRTSARADHLVRCFEATIDSPERASEILKLLGKSRVRTVLSDGVVFEFLRRAWKILERQEPPVVRIGLVRTWIEAAGEVSLDVEPLGVTDRIRAWKAAPEMTPQGWGLLFRMLWDRAELSEKHSLAQDAVTWLEEHIGLDQWSLVWQRVWSHKTGDGTLKDLALRWLSVNADQAGWSYVYQALFDAGVREPAMVDLGLEGLANSPVTIADRFIWAKISALNPDASTFVGFVTRRLCRSRIRPVTKNGLDLIVSRIPEVGIQPVLDALGVSADEPGWAHVYQGLSNRLEGKPWAAIEGLVRAGRAWLSDREDRPEWSHVWRVLVEKLPGDTELLDVGRAWLSGREDRPEWSHGWQVLVEKLPGDTELLDVGRAWLSGREDRPEWIYVKSKLESVER